MVKHTQTIRQTLKFIAKKIGKFHIYNPFLSSTT